jgi:hypothetical protein
MYGEETKAAYLYYKIKVKEGSLEGKEGNLQAERGLQERTVRS